MRSDEGIDWRDVEAAAKLMAGNWREFQCFAWSREHDLEDADRWCIWYTSHRDTGLSAQSNEMVFNERLKPFSEGDDPDVVFERHSHWAVGYLEGFSLRVFRTDGSITPAFEEFCQIKEALENYPILNEQDYTEREYQATLENYRIEMWPDKNLPEGWEVEVYGWFSDHGWNQLIESRDDQGGWAPRDKIEEALQHLGFILNELSKGT